MDCKGFDEELIPYALGLVDDEARSGMDEHLLGCAACLRAFLATKRHVEREGGDPRPSPSVKERLRADLFPRAEASRPARLWSSLARPVPLYQAFGAALAVAALAAVLPRFAQVLPARTHADVRVDTSRQVPESVGIY